MARTAREVLDDAVRRLPPGANRLVPLIHAGRAPRTALATLALEQRHIITGDRRSFEHLAARATGLRQPAVAAFFAHLAHGESLALGLLPPLATACGLGEDEAAAYEPQAGCQAYPAYAAWLALGAEPVDVVVALTANFAAWGGYCATVSRALRAHYGFAEEACGFFDFFAGPDPEGDAKALAAVASGLADGRLSEPLAHRYGRLLQDYESMFWDTLAGPSGA
ncbi:transcriptional regulator [Streptomyces sp. NPDC026206]|uniref:transcriptional regulator n=1 Tax=Streptomyces sp. NPDC026206 TaxID=3157089 RepID=UPI0033F85A09